MDTDIQTASEEAATYCNAHSDASYAAVFDRLLRDSGYTVTAPMPRRS